MVAEATIVEGNGLSVTWTSIPDGAGRFCTDDNYNPGGSNSIPVPTTDTTVYSYWKSHAINFGGSFSTITDLLIYTDGTGFGTGIAVNSSTIGLSVGQYTQATGTPGSEGDEVVANHPNVAGVTDFFGFTSVAPLTIDAGPITAVGITSHVVLQMAITSSASPGELSDETIYWKYTEI